MNPTWDLMAYDRNGQLVLSVDIRKSPTASPEWAAELRKNILAHGVYPITPYFLVALPNKFFLWKNGDAADLESKPTYTVDAAPLLTPYAEKIGRTLSELNGIGLEGVVAAWLRDLIYFGKKPAIDTDTMYWLIQSGLYETIAGGRLDYGETA